MCIHVYIQKKNKKKPIFRIFILNTRRRMTNNYSNSNGSNIRRFHNVINDCNVYILVWLEDNDNNANEKAIEMQEQLKQTINQIKVFNDPDECVDFLTDLTNQKVIFVISTKLRRIVVPAVHDFPQLKSVYIYNFDNNNITECYTNENEKVKFINMIFAYNTLYLLSGKRSLYTIK